MLKEEDKALLSMSKEEARTESIEQLTELYDRLDEKDLDITKLELVLHNAFEHGVYWSNLKHKQELEIENKKSLDSGVWFAITEFAFYGEAKQLIPDVIKAMGFSYDECIALMLDCDCNNDVLEPIINEIFDINDCDTDLTEE